MYESSDGTNRLTVALSVAERPVRVAAPGLRLLAGTGDLDGSTLTLPPHGWAVAADG